MMGFPVQTLVVQKAVKKKKPGPVDAPVRLINPDGTPFTGGTEASTPQGAAVADVTQADAVAAAADTVTKTEFDALVALANATKQTTNQMLASLRAAGMIAGS